MRKFFMVMIFVSLAIAIVGMGKIFTHNASELAVLATAASSLGFPIFIGLVMSPRKEEV